MMEGISAEEIEGIEDFIFRLSEAQLNEWKANLKVKQPYVYTVFTRFINKNQMPNEQDTLLDRRAHV